MKTMTTLKSAGFTLVEVIITLVVAGIVGTMLVSVLGTSMTKSSDPIFRMQKSFALQSVMENFVTGYEKYYAGDLPALRDAIAGVTPAPANGNEGGTVTNGKFGTYSIVDNHFIIILPSGVEDSNPDTTIKNLLKVTIKNSNNETLTYIFTG